MYDAMKKLFLLTGLILSFGSFGQNISKRLQDAYQKFENDSQLSNAISSLYVINAKTGEVIFDKNSRIGLATASTLKIITAATAYELLGKDFRYETKFGYTGSIKSKSLYGNLFIMPSGDPSLGSWRYKTSSDSVMLNDFFSVVKKLNIGKYGAFIIDQRGWEAETIPDGWIWQDIGNYYGAGATGFNWRENQFDIVMKSGSHIGDPVTIVGTKPKLETIAVASSASAAAKGSGDNSYVYYPLHSSLTIVRGTIPVNENAFTISASNPTPAIEFKTMFTHYLETQLNIKPFYVDGVSKDTTILYTHYSPSLDSLVYWFLKKSINLYGEALVKSFAFQKSGLGETDKGVEIVKNFWKDKGITLTELNIVDGSGLSPLNRVTTHAQVMVLKYAKNQSWFNSYYDAFPEYNTMKMKSGTINGVKSFCGYQKSRSGAEYIFSFLVNNYNGSSSAVVQKMYKVLDELK
jgi:D-alanyl-D-alanine carboxypeptidase/D-alanyl-D-alanine-endopeptidase (penicillin-binding protein 4)